MDTTTNGTAAVYAAVQTALREHAFENRGSLSPPQLKKLGKGLVDVLLAEQPALRDHVALLRDRGLALSSLVAAVTGLYRALTDAGDGDTAGVVLGRLSLLVSAYNELDVAAVRRDQEAMRIAVDQALAEQREQARQLEHLLHEVSTPVVPVYDGILVLPLIGAIDSRRSNDITDRLLQSITHLRAHSLIIDITGVPIVDTQVAQHLIQTVQAANLLGALVVLVGISPEIAQTLVQLGVDLRAITTLSNLQAGIQYVLRRRGLAIRALA